MGKIPLSCPLGQPITAQNSVHFARSRSKPYNENISCNPCRLSRFKKNLRRFCFADESYPSVHFTVSQHDLSTDAVLHTSHDWDSTKNVILGKKTLHLKC